MRTYGRSRGGGGHSTFRKNLFQICLEEKKVPLLFQQRFTLDTFHKQAKYMRNVAMQPREFPLEVFCSLIHQQMPASVLIQTTFNSIYSFAQNNPQMHFICTTLILTAGLKYWFWFYLHRTVTTYKFPEENK